MLCHLVLLLLVLQFAQGVLLLLPIWLDFELFQIINYVINVLLFDIYMFER